MKIVYNQRTYFLSHIEPWENLQIYYFLNTDSKLTVPISAHSLFDLYRVLDLYEITYW